MAATMSAAPTKRNRSTRPPKCCSSLVNQWPMAHTSSTLNKPRTL